LTCISKFPKLKLGRGKHGNLAPTKKSLNCQIKFYTGVQSVSIFSGKSLYTFSLFNRNRQFYRYFLA
jgi:hypothetical protein